MPLPPKPVVLISAATGFSLLGDQFLYSVLPVYFEQLGMGPIQVGIVLSANRWIRPLTNHLAHLVARRVRLDVLLLGALVLGAVTTAMYTITTSFSVLLVARLAWGMAWSFIRHIGVSELMHGVPIDSSGRTMGLYNGISRMGSIAGLFGGALLFDIFGYLTAVWILAATSLAAVPLAKIGIRPGHRASRSEAPPGRGPSVWIYSMLGFVIGAVGPGLVVSTLGRVIDTRLVNMSDVSAATVTGALLAVRYALDMTAAPWLGGLTDRYGLRATVFGFMSGGGVALVIAASVTDLVLVGALVILFFIASSALHAGVAGTISRLGSAAFSRYATASDLGAAAGPLIGWWAMDESAIDTAALTLGGCVYVVVAVLALFGIKRDVGP